MQWIHFFHKNIIEMLKSKTVINGIYIFTSMFLVTPLNFVFWVIAARQFSEEIIGICTSLLNLLMWVALLARFGVEDGLKRFLPDTMSKNKNNATLINNAVIFTISSSLPVFSVSLLILYLFVTDYPSWVWSLNFIIFMLLYVLGINLNTLFDSIAIGYRKSKMTILRVLINGILKLIFLPIFFVLNTVAILAAIDISLWLPVFLFVILIKRFAKDYRLKTKPNFRNFRNFYVYSLKHFIYNILINSPTALLPIIVLINSTKSETAYFTIGWMFVNMFYAVSMSIGTSFMVETVTKRSSIKRNVIFSVLSIFGIIMLGHLFFAFFGGNILLLFGSNYKKAYTYILIAAFSAYPYALNAVYFNYCKITNYMNILLSLNIVYIATLFTSSWILFLHFGMVGISFSLIIANIVVLCLILALERKLLFNFVKLFKRKLK